MRNVRDHLARLPINHDFNQSSNTRALLPECMMPYFASLSDNERRSAEMWACLNLRELPPSLGKLFGAVVHLTQGHWRMHPEGDDLRRLEPWGA